MHTLECKRGGERIKLRNVPTTTAIQLVASPHPPVLGFGPRIGIDVNRAAGYLDLDFGL